jgi:hypothetical protein
MVDVYKVRFHRGGLAESMKTYFEPKDWKDFLEHCKAEDEDIILRSIKCELYDKEPDDRIGWKQTWILTSRCHFDNGLKRYPFGFCDRDIMQLK